MRWSQLFTKTRREVSSSEAAANARLLIQAGYIHKEMAGVYAYLPLGKRVLDKIANIVRQEMNGIGGLEVQMTVLQPKELWQKTGRWDDNKIDNWFKTRLKNGSELGVGLTHEEPIVDAVGEYLKSYKDLPLLIYQIQNKFRNELRAKSGLLRGREFVMKDMYSFAASPRQHDEIYQTVLEAYGRVYARLGIGEITFRTFADGGIFTDKFSDEFQTISPVGEDTILVDRSKKVAVNQEIMRSPGLAKLGLNTDSMENARGVEVGNTFHLETKYTDALGVNFTDAEGKQQPVYMGCYGIGISRLMGLLAEHFADDKGLSWPDGVAPFKVHLLSLGQDKKIIEAADGLYDLFNSKQVEVFYDDRPARPGEKLADSELLGIPHRLVVGHRFLQDGRFEYAARRDLSKAGLLTEEQIFATIL
ncbi:MAG: prolyl-tRNA synthetase [Candidatus Chaera renei]|uniref:Proline--tRNA ligase n=1 Tax=Candidatus Chaera renei TaxID=2506947 RepID=A0A4Q0AIR3_9BACT|nr:MAG: prolyl-tRNA synthetase [Candidatus Chaera renei]